MDTIRISRLELSCIVGVRPAERRRRQRIALTLELELDLSRAGRSGRIAQTVDYSLVAEEIALLLEFREYRLIEMATEEIAAMILGVHPAVERAHVSLEKPEALRGRAAHASVSVSRSRTAPRVTPRSWRNPPDVRRSPGRLRDHHGARDPGRAPAGPGATEVNSICAAWLLSRVNLPVARTSPLDCNSTLSSAEIFRTRSSLPCHCPVHGSVRPIEQPANSDPPTSTAKSRMAVKGHLASAMQHPSLDSG
jgi:dihydroneopterin aldolase